MNINQLLSESAKPTVRAKPLRLLLELLIWEYSHALGIHLADALLRVFPEMMGKSIIDPLTRVGARLACTATIYLYPGSRMDPARLEHLHRVIRLLAFLDAELDRRKAVVHRQAMVRTFRSQLSAYTQSARSMVDLSDTEAPGPALQAAYVERILVAGIRAPGLLMSVASSVLGGSERQVRARVINRIEESVPQGMKNPWEVALDDTDREHGLDFYWQALTTATEGNLGSLLDDLDRLHGHQALVSPNDPPSFNGALVRNPDFRNAAERVPKMLHQLMQ